MRQFTRPDGATVYEDGTVVGVKGKVLRTNEVAGGYHQVKLAGRNFLVHRLVAEAFIPNPDNKPTVNHKDGIKAHNWVDNLEWATYTENHLHAYDTGLRGRGAEHGRAKLSEDDVRAIRKSFKDNYHGWVTDTAKRYGVDKTTISRLVRGRIYKHVR